MFENKNPETPSCTRPVYRQPSFWMAITASVIIVVLGVIFVPKLLSTPKEPTPEPTPSSEANPDKEEDNKISEKDDASKEPAEKDVQADQADSGENNTPVWKSPEQYDGDDPNIKETLTGNISTARFSDGKLIIRANVDQYISSGTCYLILSSGSESLQKTAKLVPVASYSTCEGFDIPESELSSLARPINITINVTTTDKGGTLIGVTE